LDTPSLIQKGPNLGQAWRIQAAVVVV